MAASHFNKLIDDRAVVPLFQPIVRIEDQAVFGYEVLGRSRLAGLSSPASMFGKASKFSMEAELGRLLRRQGMKHSLELPGNSVIFLNTHPSEMTDQKSLQDSLIRLLEDFPDSRMILEIHEGCGDQLPLHSKSQDVSRVSQHRALLPRFCSWTVTNSLISRRLP